MPTDVPAPPDLAELIDAWIAETQGDHRKAWGAAWFSILRWRGWLRRYGYVPGVTYYHRNVRLFNALGSIKPGEWPRAQKPERTVR